MTRTIISLDDADRKWLAERAKATGVPVSGLIREAVRRMRQDEGLDLGDLLKMTRGVWRGADGLEYQQRMRNDWR
jgi:hypothetical protein